jgi:hypothetical protein
MTATRAVHRHAADAAGPAKPANPAGPVGRLRNSLRGRHTRRLEHLERSSLAVGAEVWVISRRGWVTEAVISAIVRDRLGQRRYVCAYPALSGTTSSASLRERIVERVTVSPAQLVAWRTVPAA